MTRTIRTVCWFAALAMTLFALRSLGEALTGPPSTSLAGATRWIDREGPTTAAVWLARLAAETAAWYLLTLSLLHALGTATRFAAALRFAELLTFAGVSRLVCAGLGAGLVATTAISAVPVAASSEAEEPGTAVMRPLDDGTTQPRPGAPAAPAAPVETDEHAPSAPTPPAPRRYTVVQGDSFWTIAETLLTDRWQRPPTDSEIDPYWRALVEANRHRLVDTEDEDLILPGQVFEIPAVPPPPA